MLEEVVSFTTNPGSALCRWDSSVAADQGVANDELLVAGLRKSRYAALEAGYMANTPDKRFNPSQGHNPVLPSIKPDMSVRPQAHMHLSSSN